MTETETSNSNQEGEASFAELFSQGPKAVKEGELARGVVLSIDEDSVQVDIGFKSEGMVAAWEFMNDDGTMTIVVGDTVDVLVETVEDEEGRVVLSKEKAERLKIWDEISKAYEEDQPVEGTVIARVKGGLSVDIGVKAFLPGSQVDLRPVRNLESLMGEKTSFKIIKFNKRRGNIVLSRRALLETERRKLRQTTLETLDAGQIVDGVIKNLTDYGAFIDLGGIDGLLHITDMSWGRISHPSASGSPWGSSRFNPIPGSMRLCVIPSESACRARWCRSRTTAPSSSSSPASRGWFTCPRCRGRSG